MDFESNLISVSVRVVTCPKTNTGSRRFRYQAEKGNICNDGGRASIDPFTMKMSLHGSGGHLRRHPQTEEPRFALDLKRDVGVEQFVAT